MSNWRESFILVKDKGNLTAPFPISSLRMGLDNYFIHYRTHWTDIQVLCGARVADSRPGCGTGHTVPCLVPRCFFFLCIHIREWVIFLLAEFGYNTYGVAFDVLEMFSICNT